ncbi:MAG TPA: ABC transporter permease [Polyangiaceae bacterium]|nr:ABC transporter permease [Polyangiaceae bacterium]
MSTLERKLYRDLFQLKAQIASISLVFASGIVCLIAMRGCFIAMERAVDEFYERYRFAHVFAHASRVPVSVAPHIEALAGIATVEARIAEDASLPLPGLRQPAYGRIISLPEGRQPSANALHLKRGRTPASGRSDEVVVLEAFANAHGLEPGAEVPIVLNGKQRSMRIVGIALSPEFIYSIRPGALVDDPKRHAVLWMTQSAVTAAFGLSGCFNDVALRLEPGASEAAVRAALDRVLVPYGGTGSFSRRDQVSHRAVTQQLGQLRVLSTTVPVMFLSVAAFLVNVVLGRLIRLQRSAVALLKALGYTNREIARHYAGYVFSIVVPGSGLGLVGGALLGRHMLRLYAEFFRLPSLSLEFHVPPALVGYALVASSIAALAGALGAVRSAILLPPAEAMQPASPPRYSRSVFERLGLGVLAGTSGLMVFREIGRRPLRTVFSALGMAGAVSLLVLSRFGFDSLNAYFERTFRREQRQDIVVSFRGPAPPRVVDELARVPGVVSAEGVRAVPIRIRHEHRNRDTVLLGIAPGSTLRVLVSRNGARVPVPPDGIIVEQTLASRLGLRLGDRPELEVHEGERQTLTPVIVGFIDETAGLGVYAQAPFVASLIGDVGAVTSALLTVDPLQLEEVYRRLHRSPWILDVSDTKEEMNQMRDMNTAFINVWTAVSVVLAGGIVFGVVYNNARIGLAARARDLATLRVLGFSRRQISGILLGSEAFEVALALPVGLWLGAALARAFMENIDPEALRWNVVISPSTHFAATTLVLALALGSALWVRRRVDSLVLTDVLKARE